MIGYEGIAAELKRLEDRVQELLEANNREVERRREAESLANWFEDTFKIELDQDLPISGGDAVQAMCFQMVELVRYRTKWGSINEVKP